MTDIVIRPASADDAATIARLANLLNRSEGLDDSIFTEDLIRRDGFGPNPAFSLLMAERGGEALGYAMFHDSHNSETPARGLWLVDLYVLESARGLGIGRRLMAAVAWAGKERGALSLWWGVRSANRKARVFYAGLGAKDDDARILELNGDAMLRLAREAEGPRS